MSEWIHPAALFFLGAALIPFLTGRAQSVLLLVVPALAFWVLLVTPEGTYGVVHLLGQELILGRVDRLSLVFGYVFTLMAGIGMVYALHVKDDRQHVAAFLYAGSALGVVFAGDLLALFLFWEVMAFSSVVLIWARGREAAGAGMRYLLVHTVGGLCLLGGIVLYAGTGGGLAFSALPHGGLGPTLILLGFLLNAAVPPLHAWLADAYPEATVTGAVFLSAFTTKTAVYVLVRGFPGLEVLVWLGVAMAIYGVVYAVLENDIRRLLAYHIISQVGYMVAGVGMGSAMALNGTVAHAFAHILYKGLLFMGAGAVIAMTGRSKLTELGGLYKSMPLTLLLYMIGGFSISAFPLFSGFVSKSMVISAAAEGHRPVVLLLLTLASAGTFLHTGLKLPYFIFFGKDAGLAAKEPPANMLVAMGLAAFLCILIGVWPALLYRILPYPVAYHPYTGEHVVGSLQLLLFTALGFFFLLTRLQPERTISLDTDWVYRKGSAVFLHLVHHPLARYEAFITEIYKAMIIRPAKKLASLCWLFDDWVVDGSVNGASRMAKLFLDQAPVYLTWLAQNPVAALTIASYSTLRQVLRAMGSRHFPGLEKRLETGKAVYPERTMQPLPIGSTVLWITLFLLAYLLVYYA